MVPLTGTRRWVLHLGTGAAKLSRLDAAMRLLLHCHGKVPGAAQARQPACPSSVAATHAACSPEPHRLAEEGKREKLHWTHWMDPKGQVSSAGAARKQRCTRPGGGMPQLT